MLPHSHRRTNRKIRQLFTRGLDGVSAARLWRSLHDCPSCARLYEKYEMLEHAMENCFDAPTEQSISRVWQTVRKKHLTVQRAKKTIQLRRLLAAASLITAATCIWLFMSTGAEKEKVDLSELPAHSIMELSPRGASRTPVSYVGVRVFTVSSNPKKIHEQKKLWLKDIITFTYTYATNESGFLMLFGLQDCRHNPIWYYPDRGEGHSIEIQKNSVNEPLNDGIRLSVNHEAGTLRIVSLFSKKPISVPAVTSAVENLQNTGQLMNIDVPIFIDSADINALEYSILVQIEDSYD